jgi:hypothetical protein
MKNPFVKQDSSGLWVVAAVTGAVAAVAVAWLFFKNKRGRAAEEFESKDHSIDYLQPKPGKHKRTTDLHGLHTLHDLALSQ